MMAIEPRLSLPSVNIKNEPFGWNKKRVPSQYWWFHEDAGSDLHYLEAEMFIKFHAFCPCSPCTGFVQKHNKTSYINSLRSIPMGINIVKKSHNTLIRAGKTEQW